MVRHSQLLSDVMTSIRQIFDRLPSPQVTASAAASEPHPCPPVSVPLVEPRLHPPQRFSGDPSACRGFLTQFSLTFELQPSSFPSDRAKIAYLITLLSGKALSEPLSMQVMLHLKRNSSASLIITSAAGRRLNDCCPSSRVVAVLLNMPSILTPLQQGVAGTMSLLWCASRTVFPRHSKMNLPHESLPMISSPLSTWRSGWTIV